MSSSISESAEFSPHFNGKVIEIRAMGYDMYTAVYELVDNPLSQACGSNHIRVIMYFKGQRLYRIIITDNGVGMTIGQLREALIFNKIKARQVGDIGKFHVGMKYAFISLGSDITLISKKENGTMIGVHMNIEQMEELNTFIPTNICDTVTEGWENTHITPSYFEQFKKQISGTYIEIRNLLPRHCLSSQRCVPDMVKGLSTCYTNLPNQCMISVEPSDNPMPIAIFPKDMFYINEPDSLEESYRTIFHIYKDGDNDRLIEKISQSRQWKGKKETGGTNATPVYWEHNEYDTHKKLKKDVMKKIDKLPPIGDLIGQIEINIIQVDHDLFRKEKEWFPENSALAIDRKAFYFLRGGVRCVGSAKQLGSKFSDRVFTTTERQRCQVSFDPNLDNKIGSKFNKQMEEHALPCSILNTTLVSLYKGITAKWNKDWKAIDKARQKPDSDEEKDDDESDEKSESDESTDEMRQFQLDGSNEDVIPYTMEPVILEPEVEESKSILWRSLLKKKPLNKPVVKEPEVEEHAVEEPVVELEVEVEELEVEEEPNHDPLSMTPKIFGPFDVSHLTKERYEEFKDEFKVIAEKFGIKL